MCASPAFQAVFLCMLCNLPLHRNPLCMLLFALCSCQGGDTDKSEVARLRAAMSASPPLPVTVTLLNYRKDGTPFWNALHVAPVRDAEGVLEYYIGVQLDVTQQQEQEHKLQDTPGLEEHSAGVCACVKLCGGDVCWL